MNPFDFVTPGNILAGVSFQGGGKAASLGKRRGAHANRFPLVSLSLVLAWLALVPVQAAAFPLISEVLYDAPGSDNGHSFVELYGDPGSSLDGLALEGINGSNGAVVTVVELSGVILEDGIFVVADIDSDGNSSVPFVDLFANFDFQNGPDSIQLVLGDLVLDAVGYGDFGVDDFFAGEGNSVPEGPVGSSLARHFADFDSDDNALDFGIQEIPTPGEAVLLQVPEPQAGLLSAVGLGMLAALVRRHSPSAGSRRHRAG